MFPSQHLLIGTVFTILLYLAYPSIGIEGALIVLASTVLIDVDHYLYYVFKKKNLSLKKSYNWFIERTKFWKKLSREQRNELKGIVFFLHGVEFQVILIFLGIFIHKYFFFIFLGFLFHLILDLIYAIKYHDRLDKVSAIYDWIKFKKLKHF